VTYPGDTVSALADAAASIDLITESARAVRDDLLILFHGGPAVTPADVGQILETAVGVHGFFAGSSVERLPVQAAIEDATRAFKSLRKVRPTKAEPEAPDFDLPPPDLPFELTPDSLPRYLVERGLVEPSDEIIVDELGGGLSNVVLGWRGSGREGVVKQSRPQLRVEEEWLSDVRRVLNERDAIELLAARLPPASVPTLTFRDDKSLAFGMARAPTDAVLWKPRLLEGRLEPERARQAGRLLRQIHDCTRDDPAVATRFVAQPLLTQNRLDPWYRFAARAHPDIADVFDYAIARLLGVRRVLVHGDYVPKNIFLLDQGLLLLDYEVVHFGNPAYDVATFLNHMLLKGFREDTHRLGFLALATAFWREYTDQLDPHELELVEEETPLQIGALMLARVDGKSKVEYLVGTTGAETARKFGRHLLRNRSLSVGELLRRYKGNEFD